MKNKKGFTLVELLAVIAILAILVIIAMPNVLKQLRSARRSSFDTELKTLASEVEKQFVSDSISNPINYDTVKYSTLDSEGGKKLDISGGADLQYSISVNSQGKITCFKATNGSYYYDAPNGFDDKSTIESKEINEENTFDITNNNCSNNVTKVNVPPAGLTKQNILYYMVENGNTLHISGSKLTSSYNSVDVTSNIDEGSNRFVGTSYESITKVIIDNEILPSNTKNFFAMLFNISGIENLNNLYTNESADMSNMFSGAGYNASSFNIDLTNFDVSKVTNMYQLFAGSGYNSISWSVGDLSNWNVSKVTNMFNMFCSSGARSDVWNVGNLSKWDVSNVTNMGNMFAEAGYYSNSWNIGNVSNWNVSKVTDMEYMFAGAWQKVSDFNLDLSKWDVSNVTNMQGMFSNVASGSKTFNLNVSTWNTSKVTNMSFMFTSTGFSASNFNLDLSKWDVSKVTNMSWMFSQCGQNSSSWSIGDVSTWNTSNVTNMRDMFYYAGSKVTTFNLNISKWNTSKVTNMSEMFSGAGKEATSWNVIIPKGSNTTNIIYGKSSSVYYKHSKSGQAFTLGN